MEKVEFLVPNTFIRYNLEDIDEGVEIYYGLLELFKETTEFYHNTFADDEEYDENKEYTSLQDCIDLWEGNGYGIAQALKPTFTASIPNG